MVVGDDLGQTLEDKLGGGGTDGGDGGTDEGGSVGVEAAAVVVITLLAVLGNAMVVATLVRRSLLHHPSNRLVLSLTGSNLILTVVVLPGMVTSLLMSPASPSNAQHPTLNHRFNDSMKASSQGSVESMPLFELGDYDSSVSLSHRSNASAGSSHYSNNSSAALNSHRWSSGLPQHLGFNSSISTAGSVDNGDVSSAPLTFGLLRNNQEGTSSSSSVPDYFTTELPVYLEVSSDIMSPPPVSLYNHRDVSLLSQELHESKQTWHHSTVSPQNLEFELKRPKSMGAKELDLIFPRGEFSEIDGNQHITLKVTKRRRDNGEIKNSDNSDEGVDLSEIKDSYGEEDQKQRKEGKETRSISILGHKIKSREGKEESSDQLRGDEREFIDFSFRDSRKIDQSRPDDQRSKNVSKQRERSKIVHQESEGLVPDSDSPQQDLHQESTHFRDAGESVPEERVRHTSTRRRKQGTRHYQHRKQRLRRNRDDVDAGERGDVRIRANDSNRPQHIGIQRQRKILEEVENVTEEPVKKDTKSDFDDSKVDVEETDTSKERRFEREHSNSDDAQHGSRMGHLRMRDEVQVRIKNQQGGGEHVILVRGVQEIEEQEEKQMVVVVVDQKKPDGHHHREQHQQHVQLRVEQHLGHTQPRGHESVQTASKEGRKRIAQGDFSDQLPKLPILDLKSQNPEQEEEEDQLKHNHTLPEKRADDSLNSLREHLPQAYALRLNATDRETAELPAAGELGVRHIVGDEREKEVGEMQQMYGVEWESHRWEGGKILCQGAAFFTNFVTAASALTVAVIAIDRYLAIVRPLVYGVMVTSGRCLLMLIWCWSQALLTALPPLLGWARYERREPYGRCGVAWGDSPSYTAVWTISVFLIPFSVMVVCYYQILQVARNKCRRIRVGKVSETSPPNTPNPAAACLDGFPFPLSVAHLTSPPVGSKPMSPQPSSPKLRKLSSFGNLLSPPLGNQINHPPGINNTSRQWNGSGHPLVRHSITNGVLDARFDGGVPCRSYSVSGMLRAVDSSTNTNDPTIKPKRKLGDFGRSRSLCQVPQQPPRPCLRRVQSTFSVRHTLKKLSLGNRRSSLNWEGSPSKGFWTVFVVMGAHLLTWGPYTCMAIAEAILGRERLLLLPNWVVVTCTLLLFTASVFYPIVYGLYNRVIRKELLTCLCPTWARRRGSHVRRPSTLPSYSGSVLDFTSLRQRSASDKPELCHNPINGITGTIATISGTVGCFACPTPLVIMTEDDSGLLTRGYNPNLRKPSQDSDWCLYEHSPPISKKSKPAGTVMIGGDDQDSDVDIPATTPRQHTTRRVSAPSVLSTVREDPHTTVVCIEDAPQVSRHHSMTYRNLPTPQRKTTLLPLSVQLLSASPAAPSSMRRSRSLNKINSGDKEIVVDRNITYRSLRKKRTSSPVVRETQFSVPPANDRIQRRRGSLALMKVTAIPEDCGLTEYPEVTDSGRGSVDSGNLSRLRMLHGRGSVDSSDLTKTFSLRCRGSGDGAELSKGQLFKRRGSVDSTELAVARSKRQENRDSVDLSKNPATRQLSIDEGIGGDCLPEETNWE